MTNIATYHSKVFLNGIGTDVCPVEDNGRGHIYTVSDSERLLTALNEAQPGDTIKVMPGKYTFPRWPYLEHSVTGIKLIGSGSQQTELVGNLAVGDNTQVCGFLISGGITIGKNENVEIENNIIINDEKDPTTEIDFVSHNGILIIPKADGQGIKIHHNIVINNNRALRISSSPFLGCSAPSYDSPLEIYNNVFNGGISIDGGSRFRFYNNTATYLGTESTIETAPNLNSTFDISSFNNEGKVFDIFSNNIIQFPESVLSSILWEDQGHNKITYNNLPGDWQHWNLAVMGEGNFSLDPGLIDPDNALFKYDCDGPGVNSGPPWMDATLEGDGFAINQGFEANTIVATHMCSDSPTLLETSIVFRDNIPILNFETDYDTKIHIELFDLAGKKFLDIKPEDTFNRGKHSVQLLNGEFISSGLYLCRLLTDKGKSTEKVLIVK